MKNRIITNTGNSNRVKMGISSSMTWEQFRSQAIAGTLPADINATTDGTGTSQVGTPLTADNLLANATATALGLTGSDPTVDDAFEVIATLLNAMGVKYITETGSDGAWDWTKWNDGTFEAVYHEKQSYTPSSGPLGGWYYTQNPVTLTFPVDIGIKSVTGAWGEMTPDADIGAGAWLQFLTTTQVRYRAARAGATGAYTGALSIRIVGTY